MIFPSRSTESNGYRPTARRYGGASSFSDMKNGSRKPRAKAAPPDQTNAENFYYLKQMNARTPMVIVLSDGEELHGCIEWYDRNCIKLNRDGEPNLLIQKQYIKYLFKADEL
ncbi:MAG: hypothetical protein ABI718_02170 [Acidobacteriota bacterium]